MSVMEMIVLVGLCILTVALIQREHAAMRRTRRARVESDERSRR